MALLDGLCESSDSATRLAGVLATGFRLTLPQATKPLPKHLPLDPYPDTANVIQFADAKLDLRRFGRVGNFTVAEHWKTGKRSSEQDRLFALLLARLQDENEQVRLQSAHFLSLLNDSQSESLLTKVIADTEQRRLEGAPVSILKSVNEVWAVGPFPDGPAGLRQIHPSEQGAVDLIAQSPASDTQIRSGVEKKPPLSTAVPSFNPKPGTDRRLVRRRFPGIHVTPPRTRTPPACG